MTLTITLPLWAVLPLVLTLLLFAGALWIDLYRLGQLGFEATVGAVVLAVIGWAAILYGRYEPWLVLPVLFTVIVIWQGWKEKLKREARQIVACIVIAGWFLVIYGRLTA